MCTLLPWNSITATIGIIGWIVIIRCLCVAYRRIKSYDRRKELNRKFEIANSFDEKINILESLRKECCKYGFYDGTYPKG